jgi:hypothetical protein
VLLARVFLPKEEDEFYDKLEKRGEMSHYANMVIHPVHLLSMLVKHLLVSNALITLVLVLILTYWAQPLQIRSFRIWQCGERTRQTEPLNDSLPTEGILAKKTSEPLASLRTSSALLSHYSQEDSL